MSERVFEMVTTRIIEELEKGNIPPWQRPWLLPGRGAYNQISGKRYSFLNQMLLSREGAFASFNQWTIRLGGEIDPNERPEFVVFWKWPEEQLEKTEGETEEEQQQETKRKRRPLLLYHKVYHSSQVKFKGKSPVEYQDKREGNQVPVKESIKEAKKVLMNYIEREKINFEEGSYGEAYYSPSRDLIHIPDMQMYDEDNLEPYIGTLAHEAIHSTGHPGRLSREGIKEVSFGSERYSMEEMIAEIGSVGLLSMFNIRSDKCFENSTSYINGWLSFLKSSRQNKKTIVYAAAKAERGVNLICSTR